MALHTRRRETQDDGGDQNARERHGEERDDRHVAGCGDLDQPR
jgi:hypothetical protein